MVVAVVVVMNTEHGDGAGSLDDPNRFYLFHSSGLATHFISYCCGERRLRSDLKIFRQFVSGFLEDSASKLILA